MAMSRADALKMATEIVTEQTAPEKKANGYVHDKWVPTPIEQKTKAILAMALFLTKEEVSNASGAES
jgi:hypothetical protein